LFCTNNKDVILYKLDINVKANEIILENSEDNNLGVIPLNL